MVAPVVVADDSQTILELIVLTLQRGGIETVTAADGAAALECIREYAPRVVILDAMMPNADGYEVCRTVRADAALEQPHVIMLTANAREVDRERAEQAGVSEFMTKPFSPKALRERVQELLESQP
jgi:DNA-binding response OmpR family regulator